MVIHKNIKIIEASAFWQCGIEAFIVDKDNAFYQSIDGVLYGKDGSQLIAYPAKKEGIFFEIPKEVHNISEYFYLNSNVKILKLNSFLKIKGDTQLLGIIGTEAYQNLSQPYFYILDKEEKEFLGIESEQLHPACAIFPKEINMLNLLVLLDNIRREGYIDLFDYHLTYIFFAMEPACLCLNFLNDSNKFDEDMVSYIKHNGLAKMIFVPDESLGKYKDKWSCDKKTIFEKYKYDENSDFAVVSGFADKMINNIQPLSRLADSIGVSTQELYQAFYENYNIEILEKLKERLKLKEE